VSDNRQLGIGGAPTRATSLPTDAAGRKTYPVASGFLDYFPDAIAAVAHLSWKGNEQHNPGQPLHWARGKSADEADTMMRHFLQRGTLDTDGVRHTVKMAWRALAILQKEIEAEQAQEREQVDLEERLRRVPSPESLTLARSILQDVAKAYPEVGAAGYAVRDKTGLTPDDRYSS
jgi:hypothetical protein